MKKSMAWIGTIAFLVISMLFIYLGITIDKLWLIILSSLIAVVYTIAIIILIVDYFQCKNG